MILFLLDTTMITLYIQFQKSMMSVSCALGTVSLSSWMAFEKRGGVIQEVEKEHTNTMELWRKRHSNSNRQEGSDDGGSSKHGGFIGPRGP